MDTKAMAPNFRGFVGPRIEAGTGAKSWVSELRMGPDNELAGTAATYSEATQLAIKKAAQKCAPLPLAA
jgi:hypothetical protein